MRLIRCHVENFGILSNFDYDFLSGLNTINKQNGWGKSTFSVFLKVMFFGFGNEKKRTLLEKERARYMPWKGGAYGGWVIFEAKGKQYRVERFFGEREREDSFVLYEEKTGLFSHAYSKDIGKELFQLNEPSFKRSIFLSQNDCATGTTDLIHAKLGNLSEYVHDLDGFTEAQQKLAREINRLTPHRKTGELYKIQENMEACQWQLRIHAKQQEELAVCSRYYEEKQKKKEELVKCIQQMQGGILSAGEEREKRAKQAHYKQLCEQCRELEERLEEIESYFTNGVPEENEVREVLSLLEKEREANIAIESCAFTEAEENILDWVKENWHGIPTLDDVEVCKLQLENSEEEEETDENGRLQTVFLEIKNKIGVCSKLTLIGVILIVLGFLLCFVNIFVGFFIFVAGIFLIYHGKTGQKQDETQENEMQEEKSVATEEPKEDANLVKVDSFLSAHPVKNATDKKEHLEKIQLILVQLNSILQRDKKKQQAKEWAADYLKGIEQFYEKYNMQAEADKRQQLQDMQGKLDMYRMLMDEFFRISRQKDEFEQENNKAFLMEASLENGDLDEISQALGNLQKQLEEITDSMYADLKKMEVLQQQLDENEQIKTKLEQLEKEKENKEKRFHVLEQTIYYLQKAKESFLSKYRSPLEKSFTKYSRYLTKENLKFRIDTNMEIKLQQDGALRDTGCLSVGWQDLIGICMRLSLVDAMYPEEKPFLILDDPFVNLDEEKIRGGLWLLKQLEEEYQILYFTCHESRTLNGFVKV